MREENLSRLDAEINKYQNRIERNYDSYLDGDINKEIYKQKAEEFRKAQKSLQNKRINIEQVDDDYYGTVTHLLNMARNAPTIFENSNVEEKRSLIDLVLSNLELKDKELRWELKKPFDTMAFCNENSNWLGMRDSNPRSWDQNPVPYRLANPHRRSVIVVLPYCRQNKFARQY
jgi:hypothetical protein